MSGRLQLIAIVLISVLSLGGSYLMFFVAKGGSGWGTTNNGEFVIPAMNVTDFGWQPTDATEKVKPQMWWLWVRAEQCREVCAEALKNLRATHILMNREMERVQRALTTELAAAMPANQPNLVSIAWAAGMPGEGIYIIDPLGNLVFRYAITTDPELVLKDLKRLLKVSQIG
tara:strand:+ start:1275 stop:1790 length:516 start_codon:yes stop_codon:yes gene_type:complete